MYKRQRDAALPPDRTTALRREVEAMTAEYLAQGNRITHCPRGMSSFAAKLEEQKAAYRAGNFKGTITERRAVRKAVLLEDTATHLADDASVAQLRKWLLARGSKQLWLHCVGWLGKNKDN